MMDNVWTVKNGDYTAVVDVDQLGHMSVTNVKRLLRLSATGERPEELDALAQKLGEALCKAQARVTALSDPKEALALLSPTAQMWTDQKRIQAEIRRLQTAARRNLSGLKKVMEVYGFKKF